MKINEVEKLLSVSRSNIRFYEKEGLLTPDRAENNYRNYSEENINELKKILNLRKLGFTVEEIKYLQDGKLSFEDAVNTNILRLENELDTLKTALEMNKFLLNKNTTFDTINHDQLWNDITNAEEQGNQFIDFCMDYLMFEANIFDNMWKYVFFFNFKNLRYRKGLYGACGILLLICVLRGLSGYLIRNESFWDGFLYPFIIFAAASLILTPIFLLGKKNPRVASIILKILLALIFLFFAAIIILFIYGLVTNVL